MQKKEKSTSNESLFLMVIVRFSFEVYVTLRSNLFYVEEILGVKGYGCGRDRNIFIQCTTIADICPHSKRHRFGLYDGITESKFSFSKFTGNRILSQISSCLVEQFDYLGSLQLNGSQLLSLLSILSRSLAVALARALALDLGLHLTLLLQRDI